MKPGGILVTQSGPAGYLSLRECFTTIINTLGNVFEYSVSYQTHVPSFITLWGFGMASDGPMPTLTSDEIDRRLAHRVGKKLGHYDGETHVGMFTLPRHIRDGIANETRINRDDSPVFMV